MGFKCPDCGSTDVQRDDKDHEMMRCHQCGFHGRSSEFYTDEFLNEEWPNNGD